MGTPAWIPTFNLQNMKWHSAMQEHVSSLGRAWVSPTLAIKVEIIIIMDVCTSFRKF